MGSLPFIDVVLVSAVVDIGCCGCCRLLVWNGPAVRGRGRRILEVQWRKERTACHSKINHHVIN